jgi:hypothetical protein
MKGIHIRERSTLLRGATALLGIALVAVAAPGSARATPTAEPSAVAATTSVLFDLNGTYTDGGSARPVISDVNDILTVDMSSQHRPNANGVVVNDDTIVVTFPDDATYGAKLVSPGTIQWSNGSRWRKLTFATVPDVVGSTAATATSRLTSTGFAVRRQTQVTCDELPGHVARQNPIGGTSAPLGSTVVIDIAVKPKICP